MEIYQILFIQITFLILIVLGNSFPVQLGQYIFFWVGPKPKENLSGKTYYLRWVRTTLFYLMLLILIFTLGYYYIDKNGVELDNHPIVISVVFFAIPIFIIASILKLIEFIIKAYMYRNQIITLRDIIYVPLVDENLEVYRPVEAKCIKINIYKILSSNSLLSSEIWKFSYGDYVVCKECIFANGEKALVAIEKVNIKI